MNAQTQPIIQSYAAANDANLVRVIAMVVLSIQQAWHLLDRQVDDFDTIGLQSRFLSFGSKRATMTYVMAHAPRYARLLQSVRAGTVDRDAALYQLASIPGLQLPKAGFVLQLTTGQSGCMDVHNIRRLNLTKNDLKMSKPSIADIIAGKPISPRRLANQMARVRQYNEAIDAAGGSGVLWDDWCVYMENHSKHEARYPAPKDGQTADALHLSHLGLAPKPLII